MKRTKIVSTIGPATSAPERLRAIIDAGTDVVRLNFSHGTLEEHGRLIKDTRSISETIGRPVAVLQDLAGPKVRTGAIGEGPVELVPGATFTLTTRDVIGDANGASITYPGLTGDVRPGDALLLGDGAIELVVEDATDAEIVCRVVVGGRLDSHKGVNVPSRSLSAPALTDKDRLDLEFGLARCVDYVALSFVRSADDVREARGLIGADGRDVGLIAKIERRAALEAIDEILAEVDGIMIARGDLGVEIPIEEIPTAQKTLIAKANVAGKPVITATQMLGSMVGNPRPTRAEATDVANAILDGSDAVMLSEETAVGEYPVEAVRTMRRIADEAESIFPFDAWTSKFAGGPSAGVEAAVAHSACRLADEVGAGAIVTFTRSGSTARLVARHRPSRPILGLTSDPDTYRRLALVWGVLPLRTEAAEDLDEIERAALGAARNSGLVRPGQPVVITAGYPIPVRGTTNLIKVAVV
jgi:pyruvate kinase